jgi:hypothetical protein
MRNSFVIGQDFLERLIKNPELENIILGTGVPAKDLQTKLHLLNLKAPFLVGDRDEPTNGLMHYNRLAELEDVTRYRFIACFDTDEWTLIAPVQSAVYKLLGKAVNSHPRLLKVTTAAVWFERAGGIRNDAHIHGILLKDGRPFEVFGENRPGDFKIHVFGGSTASSILRCSERVWPEMLAEKLQKVKFNATVYSWGYHRAPFGNKLITFLRDAQYYRPDLVIFYSLKPYETLLYAARMNVLSVFTAYGAHDFTNNMRWSYKCETSNGAKHSAGTNEIFEIQQGIMTALEKLFSFTFWSVIPPNGELLPEAQEQSLLDLSPGYLSVLRREKETALSVAGDCIKDYSDSFSGVADIFDMYVDTHHLTDRGNSIIAERFAKDILLAFGGDKKETERA